MTMRHGGRRVSAGGAESLCRLVWLALTLLVAISYTGTAGCGRKAASPQRQEAGVTLPPLPEAWRSMVESSAPDELVWSDRIREVYAALEPTQQQEMLSKGEFVFRLSDLPKGSADIIRNYFAQNASARSWAQSKLGTSLDLSQIAFKFARTPDGKYVSFVRQAPNGDTGNLYIGAWPAQDQERK